VLYSFELFRTKYAAVQKGKETRFTFKATAWNILSFVRSYFCQ